MLLWAFLASTALCELKQGDDPYQILGISNRATRAEIKAAYRKLTTKLHPDVNKEKDATAKWVKVNDAYEILKDPDRKSSFDRYGIILKEKSEVAASGPRFGFHSYSYFGEEQKDVRLRNLTTVTALNYDEFMKNTTEAIFFVYNSLVTEDAQHKLDFFEVFAERTKKFIKCGVIDVEYSAGLARTIGATEMPSFIYVRKLVNKTVSVPMKKPVETMRDLDEFLIQQWPSFIHHFKSPKKLPDFLKADPTAIHVVLFEREHSSNLLFHRIASLLNDNVVYAIVEDSSLETSKQFNIQTYPLILVYRHHSLPPRRVYFVSRLVKELTEYGKPLLFPVDRYTLRRLCKDICFIRCGEPHAQIAEKLLSLNVSVGITNPDSKFAQSLGLAEGSWTAVFPEVGQYAVLDNHDNEIDNVEQFLVDYADGLIKIKSFPENFTMEFSWNAFLAETMRFLRFLGTVIRPAALPLTFAIIFFTLHFVQKSWQKRSSKPLPVKDHRRRERHSSKKAPKQ